MTRWLKECPTWQTIIKTIDRKRVRGKEVEKITDEFERRVSKKVRHAEMGQRDFLVLIELSSSRVDWGFNIHFVG